METSVIGNPSLSLLSSLFSLSLTLLLFQICLSYRQLDGIAELSSPPLPHSPLFSEKSLQGGRRGAPVNLLTGHTHTQTYGQRVRVRERERERERRGGWNRLQWNQDNPLDWLDWHQELKDGLRG